jgi:hypothetical protein
VILIDNEKPVVFLVYDLGQGGISFVHAGVAQVKSAEIRMDVLIFDTRKNFDYYIIQINGLVKKRQLISDPTS